MTIALYILFFFEGFYVCSWLVDETSRLQGKITAAQRERSRWMDNRSEQLDERFRQLTRLCKLVTSVAEARKGP
jgi:hypothetical protein